MTTKKRPAQGRLPPLPPDIEFECGDYEVTVTRCFMTIGGSASMPAWAVTCQGTIVDGLYIPVAIVEERPAAERWISTRADVWRWLSERVPELDLETLYGAMLDAIDCHDDGTDGKRERKTYVKDNGAWKSET